MSLYLEYGNRTDLMFRFVNLYDKYMGTFDSAGDFPLTIVERHILININEHHGITNTELAAMLGRTPGAITQIIVKLEQKDLVERVKHKSNAKAVHIFPTPRGVTSAIACKSREILCMRRMMAQLAIFHSKEDIQTFWHVLHSFVPVIADCSM